MTSVTGQSAFEWTLFAICWRHDAVRGRSAKGHCVFFPPQESVRRLRRSVSLR